MKYIILEDDAETLAHLYCLLKEWQPDKKFVLIKCNVNSNYSKEEAEELEKSKVRRYIEEKARTDSKEEMPQVEIMKTPEDLLNSVVDNVHLFQKDDILIMDITLFEKTDGRKDNDFTEYASVRLAKKLTIDMAKLPAASVRFYTRAKSKSDIKAFCEQTGGVWYVPALRPQDFYADGAGMERSVFIKKILRIVEGQKGDVDGNRNVSNGTGID